MEPLKYTEDHEWISVKGDIATIGISEHAQEQLGDVVFVELPSVGQSIEKGGEAAVVESVKAASDVLAPIDGEVVEVNSALEDNPSLVNSDAQTKGWFMKIRIANAGQLDGLMDEAAYKAHISDEE